MSVRHYLHALHESWRWLMLSVLGGLLLALLWAVLANPTYESAAQMLVTVRPPETVGTQSVADQLATDYLLTQEEIIKSRRVALKVVERLRLADSPAMALALGWTAENGPQADFVATAIESGLRIGSSVVNSRVISIGYASGDPESATAIANAFADAYADVSIDLQAEPARRTAAWYGRQMEDIQRQITAAQTALAEKEKALGITAPKGAADADTIRLDALSSQLAAVQAQDAVTAAREGGGALPDTLSSPVVQTLLSEVARLEGQRQQLAIMAGRNNPDYRQLDSQITALRAQLDEQRALVRRSVSVSSAQARSTISSLGGAVAAQRRRVIEARADKNAVSVAQQDLVNLEGVYDQIAARRAQLRILGDPSQTNVSVLTRAVPNPIAVWPRPKIMIAAGVVLGLLTGAALICAREYAELRVRRPEELEKWLGIYDLGVIRVSTVHRRTALVQRLRLTRSDGEAAYGG